MRKIWQNEGCLWSTTVAWKTIIQNFKMVYSYHYRSCSRFEVFHSAEINFLVHSLIRTFARDEHQNESHVDVVHLAAAQTTAEPFQAVEDHPGPPKPKNAELKEQDVNIRRDIKVKVKKKTVLPPIKQKITKTTENVGNITWPTMDELEVPKEIKAQYEDWFKIGLNRQRQKARGDEIPRVRNPDLIITGEEPF